jgi:hypothetical protein
VLVIRTLIAAALIIGGGTQARAAEESEASCKGVGERGVQSQDAAAIYAFVLGRQSEKTDQCMSYVRLDNKRASVEAVRSIARTVCHDQDVYAAFYLRAKHEPAKLIGDACKMYPDGTYFDAVSRLNVDPSKGSW